MRRVLDGARFNEIANAPDVRPWLGGSGELDIRPLVSDPANFCFVTEDRLGGYLYVRRAPGYYEVHTLALPAGRGRAMLAARTASLRFMFTVSDALEIVTVVPDGNVGASTWAEHAGFREMYRRERAIQIRNEIVGASYRTLTYNEWVLRDGFNREVGAQFHEEIHRFTPNDHGEDPAHDAFVGATMLGIREGNGAKAVPMYNRFALHAGYEPIRVLSLTPPTLDIGSAILQITQAGLDILHIRTARSALSEIEDNAGESACQLARPSQQAEAS